MFSETRFYVRHHAVRVDCTKYNGITYSRACAKNKNKTPTRECLLARGGGLAATAAGALSIRRPPPTPPPPRRTVGRISRRKITIYTYPKSVRA